MTVFSFDEFQTQKPEWNDILKLRKLSKQRKEGNNGLKSEWRRCLSKKELIGDWD